MTVKSILSTLFSGLGKPTFRSVADDYLAVSLANCCAHVQKYTRSRFDLWVYPRIGGLRIDRVKPQQIIDCVLDFQAAAPSQSRRLLQVISGVYRYAKAWMFAGGAGEPPQVPFTAAGIVSDNFTVSDQPHIMAFADFERCLAWAWLESLSEQTS